MTLEYTLDQLYTEQAIVERDMSGGDGYGAPTEAHWEYHLTVPCRHWWMRSTGVRSANREYVTPAREVPITEGGMIMPLGTDVSEQDRITTIQDRNGNPLIKGIFTITAVVNEHDHLEIDMTRTTVGP
jgi:hypothetical protein